MKMEIQQMQKGFIKMGWEEGEKNGNSGNAMFCCSYSGAILTVCGICDVCVCVHACMYVMGFESQLQDSS